MKIFYVLALAALQITVAPVVALQASGAAHLRAAAAHSLAMPGPLDKDVTIIYENPNGSQPIIFTP